MTQVIMKLVTGPQAFCRIFFKMYEKRTFDEIVEYVKLYLVKIPMWSQERLYFTTLFTTIERETAKKIKHKGGSFGALITDLFKAFFCL